MLKKSWNYGLRFAAAIMRGFAFPLLFLAGQATAFSFAMPVPRTRMPLTIRGGAGADYITDVPMGPADPILGLTEEFKKDTDPDKIMEKAGLDVKRYRYFEPTTKGLDYDGMIEDLKAAPEGSIILLHACAHNPSGVDPSPEQWKAISDVCKEGNHVVFFDCAYQGFATGDARADAFAIRLFVEEGHNLMLAQSYAKNFGLYGERVGCLSIVCKSTEEKDRVNSQLKRVIRPMYSSPPIHGAGIVQEVLGCDVLRPQYYEECKSMADRIAEMRVLLKAELIATGSTLSWEFITEQIGMFAYTGMTKDMCEKLINKHHIFLTKDGRVSMAGINSKNVKKIAAAIHDVTQG
mmetsp:Transcript_102476/g.293380  ORF Transcript_102476/g.293380 Transcript_102476/m.293380 type:complete len:349 (-) Transcript_102476:206-1252(-)